MKQLCLILLAAGMRPAFAAGVGTTSANFLQWSVGPRAAAMGEAQVAVADDVYAAYWNPAGLAQLRVQEAGFVQHQYVEGISQQFLAYAVPTSSFGTIAASVNYLSVGKFQGYDAAGLPTVQVGADDLALGVSYARAVFQDRRTASHLALGVTPKFIRERLDTVTAQAYAGDIGLLMAPGKRWSDYLKGWRAGLVFRNAGTAIRYDRDAFPLPRRWDLGVSYSGLLRDEKVTIALDGRQPHAGARSFGAGIELFTLPFLVMRAGYTSAGDLGNGLRLGGGIRFKTIHIDYAYAAAGDFGGTHRFGITLRFGKLPEDPEFIAQEWYEKGLRDYKRRRYTEALVKFNKALEIDPSHPDALTFMKKTYEELKTIVPQ